VKGKWLIIPVEVKAREFHSRLLLSLTAVNAGFNVIFGSKNQIMNNIPRFPKGIYFDKSISINKVWFFDKLQENGIKIVSIDEEGLMSQNNSHKYITQRIGEVTLGMVEKVFTWGESERELICDYYPDFKDKIISSGNPRVDILSKEYNQIYNQQALKYKEEFGHFILFPSNFTVNHALGSKNFDALLRELGRVKNKADIKHYKEKAGFFERTFKKFTELICELAARYPSINIIVRPHPSEDHYHWKAIAKKYRNVFVKYEGAIAPWIKASQVVIHSSCTTGLEAFLMHKTVLSYLPYTDHEYVKHISNDVSIVFHKQEDILTNIDQYLIAGYSDPNVKMKLITLRRHISNLDAELATERIVRALKAIPLEEDTLDFRTDYISKAKDTFRRFKKAVKYNNPANRYADQKFNGSSLSEVRNIYEQFHKINGIANSFKISELTKDIYTITS